MEELAATAKAFKKAVIDYAKLQAAFSAVFSRMKALSKRTLLSGAHLRPIVDGLSQILHQNPVEDT